MPAIDVDFEQGRREEVINHIKDVYGEDHVSQVITFGTLQAKNAVRDAARVLDYPYNTGDRICKLIGDELGITIDKALATNPDLKKAYETEEDVKAVIDAAKSIEGHVRGEGVHACATIICRDPMADHVPCLLYTSVHELELERLQHDGRVMVGPDVERRLVAREAPVRHGALGRRCV